MKFSTSPTTMRCACLFVITLAGAAACIALAQCDCDNVAIAALGVTAIVGHSLVLECLLFSARIAAMKALERLRDELRLAHAGSGGAYAWTKQFPSRPGFDAFLLDTGCELRQWQLRAAALQEKVHGRKFWSPVRPLMKEWKMIDACTISPLKTLLDATWWTGGGYNMVLRAQPSNNPAPSWLRNRNR